MDPSKQRRLEAAGWTVGDAEKLLGPEGQVYLLRRGFGGPVVGVFTRPELAKRAADRLAAAAGLTGAWDDRPHGWVLGFAANSPDPFVIDTWATDTVGEVCFGQG